MSMRLRPIMPALAALAVLFPAASQAAETRCGWFYNPSPANAWLIDKDGEWTIAEQGGFQAEGDWPQIGEQVVVNGNKGYGCTCARVETGDGRILRIISSQPKTLAACRADPALQGKEPEAPGQQ